jgi:hypothetical protein
MSNTKLNVAIVSTMLLLATAIIASPMKIANAQQQVYRYRSLWKYKTSQNCDRWYDSRWILITPPLARTALVRL